jgi:hypothetical protein
MKFSGPYNMVAFAMRGSSKGLLALRSTVLKKFESESRKLENRGVNVILPGDEK